MGEIKNISYTFDRPSEYTGLLTSKPIVWTGALSSKKPKDDFYGVPLEEALKQSEKGWPEGLKDISRELDDMRALNKINSRPAYENSVAGFAPDIPRAVAGLPDSMLAQGAEHVKAKPVIHMLINSVFSCGIKHNTVLWRGAAVLSFIDKLEQEGHSVEITLYSHNRCFGVKGPYVDFMLTLKRAGESLDLDRMGYWLVSPTVHRRLFFRLCELHDIEGQYSGNYGRPENFSSEKITEINPTVHMGKMDRNFSTKEKAFNFVKNHIETSLEKAWAQQEV
ncbi:MAG: hypothetical protein KGL39_11800 [Patescibacteria group bacterium]|nr:hypothetical protein [Patescibacteria group bacterium]